RTGTVRRVHRAPRGRRGALVCHPGVLRRRPACGNARGPRHAHQAASLAAGVHHRAGRAVWLLHQRHDHAGGRTLEDDTPTDRGADPHGACGESLPLRHPCPDPARGQTRGRGDDMKQPTMIRFSFEQPLIASRRSFLKTGGGVVVTFAFGAPKLVTAASGATAKTVATDEVDGFLAIDAQGRVTVYSGKVDLGTGLETAITQIAAEELSVPLDHVTVIQGDTAVTPDQGITWGSLSIQNGGMQIRQAAATAREALLARAARVQGLPRETLKIKDGRIAPASSDKGWSYAELVDGRELHLKVDPKAPLKDPQDYTIVGKPVARLDIPAKVVGHFTYMQDFRLKGMIHARVIRPSALKAVLLTWTDQKARDIPGNF